MTRSHRTYCALASACSLTVAVAMPAGCADARGRDACAANDHRHRQRASTPKPLDKKSNASIKKAVAQARAKAVPLAIANGRGRGCDAVATRRDPARRAGRDRQGAAAALLLSRDRSVKKARFGPDQYCGTVRTRIFRRDAQGRRKAVGTRTRRQCRIPSYVSSNLTMVFSTT